MSAAKQFDQYDVMYVSALEVVCDGGQGPLGHPRVFLHIDHTAGQIVCPYCSCTFIYKPPVRPMG
jgi:uncharacterized Zn-finger protein